jgi:hypothetical protein
MAVRDIRSDLQQNIALFTVVAGDGTTAGTGIDTSSFELGIMFAPIVTGTVTGTLDFTLQESDDDGGGDPYTEITEADRLIGTLAGLQATAAQVEGDTLKTIGVVGGKAFKRISVVGTGTAAGDVTAVVTQSGEQLPVV